MKWPILVLMPLVWGHVHVEGVTRHIGLVVDSPNSNPETPWRYVIEEPHTKFIRLHFVRIKDTSGLDYRIVLKDYKSEVVSVYGPAELGAKHELWTSVIYGTRVLVEIESTVPVVGLSFEIADYDYWRDEGRSLSIRGKDNKREHIATIKDDPALVNTSKAVALVYFTDGGPKSCSGFLLSPNLLLTNEHCIYKEDMCASIKAEFGFQRDALGFVQHGRPQYGCMKVEKISHPLDFALIRLEGTPGATWGHLQLSDYSPVEEPLYLVGHPSGEPKQVVRKNCRAEAVDVRGRTRAFTDLAHSCDTLSGNSGSPVFNLRHEVVGLHHLEFDFDFPIQNRAVEIRRIYDEIAPFLK